MSVIGRAMPFLIPSAFVFNLTGATTNLRTAAVAAGWDQAMAVEGVIPSGTYVNTAGLTIDGSFPGGVKLSIQTGAGIGGQGGAHAVQGIGAQNGNNGNAGALALAVSVAVTIDNLGTIAGGGGGGGSGSGALNPDLGVLQGGRGGAGATLPGSAEPQSPGDTGYGGCYAGQGAAGGSPGVAGNNGNAGGSVSWDLWPGGYSGGAAGAAGACVTGNSNITWINTGTRLGSIS